MKLGLVYQDHFEYKSDILDFFINEYSNGNISSTRKPTKNGDYIYRPYLVFYDRITNEVHFIELGVIRSAKNIYQDYPTAEKFKKDLLKIMENAEKTGYPFHKVIEIVFNQRIS